MDASLHVEPFGFFSLDALRAGWYLMWRQFVRILPIVVAAGAIGGALTGLGMIPVGILVISLGIVAATIWANVLVPRLASRWTEARYGYALSGPLAVWWGITWRVLVAALVAGVITYPFDAVATSLAKSFKGSAMGVAGQLLTALLALANFAVTMLATGWAMSRVAAAQISGLPVISMASEPARSASPTLATTPASAMAAPVAAPAPAPEAPRARGTDGKRQCPKCGLYETERGAVIGWYCTVCGWREARR
jgi:hypothetical protein